MRGMRATFGALMEFIDIVRYLGALALVLALVGVAAIFIKRYGVPGVVGGKGRRLAIVETADARQKYPPCHRSVRRRRAPDLAIGPQGANVIDRPAPRPVFSPETEVKAAPEPLPESATGAAA